RRQPQLDRLASRRGVLARVDLAALAPAVRQVGAAQAARGDDDAIERSAVHPDRRDAARQAYGLDLRGRALEVFEQDEQGARLGHAAAFGQAVGGARHVEIAVAAEPAWQFDPRAAVAERLRRASLGERARFVAPPHPRLDAPAPAARCVIGIRFEQVPQALARAGARRFTDYAEVTRHVAVVEPQIQRD